MKIAPRLLFWAQMYSAVLSAATQVGVLRWMLGHIENLCSPTNTQRFTCNGTKVVYNVSVIWVSFFFRASQFSPSLVIHTR